MDIYVAPCFFVGGIIAILFFLVKFFEMRFVTKETKPLKVLVVDSIYVFITATISVFLIKHFKILKTLKGINGQEITVDITSPQAFVDKPNF